MKNKDERLEKNLYEWLNETEEMEKQVCKLMDGEISKKDLIKTASIIKYRFKRLEDTIKFY